MNDKPISGASRRTVLAAVAGAGFVGLSSGRVRALGRYEAVESVIDGMVRDHGFQGVAAVGCGGRIEHVRSAGFWNIARNMPMEPDRQMGVASISKRLTATAVMRLVDQGLLSLDEPVTRWLPDYRADTGSRLTLRRLLSNCSGLADAFMPAVRAAPGLLAEPWISTEEAIRLFASGDLIFEPGARFDYVLVNWIIVQGVIEAATGRPYAEAMRSLVLEPLGMRRTTPIKPNDAASYRTVSPPVEWTNPRPPFLVAGGGYYSTAADLMRFAHRVYDTDFLSRTSRDQLTTIEVKSDSYALGGRMRKVAIQGVEVEAAWDTGSSSGFRSVLGYRLDRQGTVVILNNTAISQRVMDGFAEALLRAHAADHAAAA